MLMDCIHIFLVKCLLISTGWFGNKQDKKRGGGINLLRFHSHLTRARERPRLA